MNRNLLKYLFAGLGTGVAAGIFLAPRSGRDTREAIRCGAVATRDRVIQQAEELRGQARGWLETGRSAIIRQQEGILAALEEGKRVYQAAAKAG